MPESIGVFNFILDDTNGLFRRDGKLDRTIKELSS
jgi:hypothetical protein